MDCFLLLFLVTLRALFEYNAQDEEELSFPEGALIKLTRTDDNGVDDGWWEGSYEGKVGVFPSVVVEMVSSNSPQVNENSRTCAIIATIVNVR